jgi:hypothetical protein
MAADAAAREPGRGYRRTDMRREALTASWLLATMVTAAVISYGVEPGGFQQFIKDKVLLGGEYKAQACRRNTRSAARSTSS